METAQLHPRARTYMSSVQLSRSLPECSPGKFVSRPLSHRRATPSTGRRGRHAPSPCPCPSPFLGLPSCPWAFRARCHHSLGGVVAYLGPQVPWVEGAASAAIRSGMHWGCCLTLSAALSPEPGAQVDQLNADLPFVAGAGMERSWYDSQRIQFAQAMHNWAIGRNSVSLGYWGI